MRMEFYGIYFLVSLILFTSIESKWIPEANMTNEYNINFNKTKIVEKNHNIMNDSNKIQLIDRFNKKDRIVFMDADKKCETMNQTDDGFEAKDIEVIQLDNIYSVTINLIKDDVSVHDVEVEGISLFDIVKSDCGSARICNDLKMNSLDPNTITIGFLSAYKWSQVSC